MTEPSPTPSTPAPETTRLSGAPVFRRAEPPLQDPDRLRLDRSLAVLDANRRAWAHTAPADHLPVIDALIDSVARHADAWVNACVDMKGVRDDPHARGQEWGGGPYVVLRNLIRLREALRDIAATGAPRPASVQVRDGRTVARVYPTDLIERLALAGCTADVVMQEGVTPEILPATQATAYREQPGEGRVRLVLGAGNVSAIAPCDALDALFEHREVVILKLNPVLEGLHGLLEQAFAPLVERGVLRVVTGGALVGAYLTEHPLVHAVHITGSDKTYDAILFGTGEEGERRKADRQPRLSKPVSAELGGVSPTIVVPGPWTARDIDYHAHGLATALANNAGCNCATTRVIIQHDAWPKRHELLRRTREVLANVPARHAFYPGAHDRWANFMTEHPDAHRIGEHSGTHLPWTLIEDVKADTDDVAFRAEPFCSLMSETALSAPDVPAYIRRAVDFANERVWGTLNATILVHPESLRDPDVAAAVEQAVRDLRYGTVAVNLFSGLGWAMVGAPWGAYPGNEMHDIGSGVGWTHNPMMFTRAEKTVVRAPFRITPAPAVFVLFREYERAVRAMTLMMARPSVKHVLAMLPAMLRGHRKVR